MNNNTPDRETPHSGKTARQNRDSIKIVFDAELQDLPLCKRIALFCCACCSYYDKKRSYLYIRENSLESNVSLAACCGCCSTYDVTNVSYFDNPPYAPVCRLAPFPCCCICTSEQPKVEVMDYSCLCCFANIDPCCCGKQVVIMPFEKFPFPCCFMTNRVGCCDNCCGCCGQMTGNPKIFSAFIPQPLDADAFVAVAQQTMFGTVDTATLNSALLKV